jgi:hypothetical protein
MTTTKTAARPFRLLALATLFGTIGLAAQATPVQVSKQQASAFGANAAATVTIFDDAEQPAGDRVRAGGFAVRTDLLGDFVAWCLDISTSLRLSSAYRVTQDQAAFTPFADTTPISLDRKQRIQGAFDTAYRDLDLTEAQDSAGFQLALWELVYEDESALGVGSGSFHATGDAAVLARADAILAGLAGPASGHYRLVFLESADRVNSGRHKSQNLVTVVPTPLPAAGLLLLGGLAGLGALRRFKRA